MFNHFLVFFNASWHYINQELKGQGWQKAKPIKGYHTNPHSPHLHLLYMKHIQKLWGLEKLSSGGKQRVSMMVFPLQRAFPNISNAIQLYCWHWWKFSNAWETTAQIPPKIRADCVCGCQRHFWGACFCCDWHWQSHAVSLRWLWEVRTLKLDGVAGQGRSRQHDNAAPCC